MFMKLYPLAFAAILTGGILAFAPAKEKPNTLIFKYTGPSPNTDYLDPENWSTSDLEECESEGQVKCLVSPKSSSVVTIMDLVEEITDNGFANINTIDTRS